MKTFPHKSTKRCQCTHDWGRDTERYPVIFLGQPPLVGKDHILEYWSDNPEIALREGDMCPECTYYRWEMIDRNGNVIE